MNQWAVSALTQSSTYTRSEFGSCLRLRGVGDRCFCEYLSKVR